MKRLVVLLMILLAMPIVLAQNLDFGFFDQSDIPHYSDVGVTFFHIPNQTLENSTIDASVMFFPADGIDSFDVVLSKDGVPLEKEYYPADDPSGNTGTIFEWNISIEKNTTLDFKIVANNKNYDTKKFFVESIPRKYINRTFSEKTVMIDLRNVGDDIALRKKLSENGIEFTEDEFKQMRENSRKLNITKKTRKDILLYEGNMTITRSKTTFDLKNIEGLDIYIIESIDKSIANNASEISFSRQPIILENDPLIMWHLDDEMTDSISYEIEKKGTVEGDLTGNTVLLTSEMTKDEKRHLWKTILPIALIPLVVLIIIYFGTINVRKRK